MLLFLISGGWGGGAGNKIIKGICAVFRCGCQSVFHWEWCVVQEQRSTMVILLQLEESFGSPLNSPPQAKTTFSSLCKC